MLRFGSMLLATAFAGASGCSLLLSSDDGEPEPSPDASVADAADAEPIEGPCGGFDNLSTTFDALDPRWLPNTSGDGLVTIESEGLSLAVNGAVGSEASYVTSAAYDLHAGGLRTVLNLPNDADVTATLSLFAFDPDQPVGNAGSFINVDWTEANFSVTEILPNDNDSFTNVARIDDPFWQFRVDATGALVIESGTGPGDLTVRVNMQTAVDLSKVHLRYSISNGGTTGAGELVVSSLNANAPNAVLCPLSDLSDSFDGMSFAPHWGERLQPAECMVTIDDGVTLTTTTPSCGLISARAYRFDGRASVVVSNISDVDGDETSLELFDVARGSRIRIFVLGTEVFAEVTDTGLNANQPLTPGTQLVRLEIRVIGPNLALSVVEDGGSPRMVGMAPLSSVELDRFQLFFGVSGSSATARFEALNTSN